MNMMATDEPLSEKEWELIRTVRLLKRTRHNYSLEFELFVRQMIEELLEED